MNDAIIRIIYKQETFYEQIGTVKAGGTLPPEAVLRSACLHIIII